MPEYLSPGVYVEEVPSAVQAIAGVGTSTAGFIGIVPDQVKVAVSNRAYDPVKASQKAAAREERPATAPRGRTAAARDVDETASITPPAGGQPDPTQRYVEINGTIQTPADTVKLCTSFREFRDAFGGTSPDFQSDLTGFSADEGHNRLAHAVYGFFNNGGQRCYVMRVADSSKIEPALEKFEAIDEIAIVAAPGITDAAVRSAILAHCDRTKDRFAIFDTPENPDAVDDSMLPPTSKNGALYFPWIEVADPVQKLRRTGDRETIFVPPSGHVAGIYARVDIERGVHKAPANEVVRGALGVRVAVTKAKQAGLNPVGVNCIREMNGAIRVWGARTIGGDRNGDFKYINVRRLFLYLSESIDEGTQWTVFEPNNEQLWAKISRNVTAFLTNVWRDGALFGRTPPEAFYVKCDRETNPPSERELGKVITEIGVAIVRPAEFVIFRISQWTAAEGK
jgi:Bacteriophage tail sheath protein